MFSDFTFSIARDRKLKTKNSKILDENTIEIRLGVFERTFKKMQTVFIFCKVGLL
jgi:hypothetical protein